VLNNKADMLYRTMAIIGGACLLALTKLMQMNGRSDGADGLNLFVKTLSVCLED